MGKSRLAGLASLFFLLCSITAHAVTYPACDPTAAQPPNTYLLTAYYTVTSDQLEQMQLAHENGILLVTPSWTKTVCPWSLSVMIKGRVPYSPSQSQYGLYYGNREDSTFSSTTANALKFNSVGNNLAFVFLKKPNGNPSTFNNASLYFGLDKVVGNLPTGGDGVLLIVLQYYFQETS